MTCSNSLKELASVLAMSGQWFKPAPASLGFRLSLSTFCRLRLSPPSQPWFFFKSTHRLGIRGEHTSPSNRSCRSKVVDHPAAIRVNLYNMFFGVF